MKRILCLFVFSLLVSAPAWAIPSMITYQGTLKEQGNPANGVKTITFQLTDQSGNIPYSTIISSQVSVVNGLFSAQLAFQLSQPYTWDTITPYLKVTVNGQLLSPTEAVAAAAYANVSNTVVDGAITRAKLDSSAQAFLTPTGSVIAFAGQSAPSGWLLCDGSGVSRTQYATLFSVIGTIWGAGDGSTTFNLPDLRGRTPIGTGQGAGLTNRILGQTMGEETHTLSVNEMPAHNHGVNDPGHSHQFGGFPSANGAALNASAGGTQIYDSFFATLTTNNSMTGISIQNAGGGVAHNVMQPSAVVNFIIKY